MSTRRRSSWPNPSGSAASLLLAAAIYFAPNGSAHARCGENEGTCQASAASADRCGEHTREDAVFEAACFQEARRTGADAQAVETTPVGGYTLSPGGVGVKMEIGFPFLDVAMLLGFVDRVHLGIGYRGVYGLSSSPYLELKWSANPRWRNRLGLAIRLRLGFALPRFPLSEFPYHNIQSGEYGPFGELWFLGTVRWGRHGFLWGLGAKVSGNVPEDDLDCRWECLVRNPEGALGMISTELGYELRVNPTVSFFTTFGVDFFIKNNRFPAMPRVRLGVVMGP